MTLTNRNQTARIPRRLIRPCHNISLSLLGRGQGEGLLSYYGAVLLKAILPIHVCMALATLIAATACAAADNKADRSPSKPQTRSATATPSLASQLASLMNRPPHAQALGSACVIDLKTGATVFEHNADAALVPASNMKVFAMAAALIELGTDFQFQTYLATDGRNLLLIGDGDPGLGDEKLAGRHGESSTAVFDRFAGSLIKRNLRNIPGDLIYDDSIFDNQRIHDSWESEDIGKWYAAPVTGLTVNDGCLDITVTPVGKQNATFTVSMVPENSLAKIINEVRFGANGSPLLHNIGGTLNYRISGTTNKRYTFGPVAFADPSLLCAHALNSAMAEKNITLQGSIKHGVVRNAGGFLPLQAQIIDVHTTSLADVLNRAGKDSQNLFAECLLKRAGYAWSKRKGSQQPVGSWSTGAEAVKEMLQVARINTAGLIVADGSGLSRDNRCTARQLASTNAWISKSASSALYRDSLAIAGVDGSLRKRMKGEDGRIRGKTGTMRGIRTLSGYIDDDNGPRYAFAIMFNNYPGTSAPYKDLQDKVCALLSDYAN